VVGAESAILALQLLACAATIDRLTVVKVVDRGSDQGDTGKACALGAALAHPLASLTRKEPHLALVVAEGTAALCDQGVAWEAELDSARAKRNWTVLGDARAAEITDARIHSQRAHTRAAARFDASFRQLEAHFGALGDECPRIPEKEEFVVLFGLVTGTLALLHDKAGGTGNDVPLDRLAVVARASECLDDAAWWSAPKALRAGAWATIPGSGPADVDAWALLDEAAREGDASGVRVARGVQVLLAANAGRADIVEQALRAHAAAIAATPRDAEWALLDAYAYEVSLHQSDLLWTAATGHRTETFGALPSDVAVAPVAPIGPDPFGSFGAPEGPAPLPAPIEPAPVAPEETP
jgi:hypothetical protein